MTKRERTNADNADKAYVERFGDIACLLDVLQMELEAHQDRAAKRPDWGLVGDLDYIRENLVTLVAFASGKETHAVQEFLDDQRALDDAE